MKNLKFDGYVKKLNSCIRLCNSEWIMIIDADYVISKDLVSEILNFNLKSKYIGANADIYHSVFNSIIKEKLYPSKIILFKKIRQNIQKLDIKRYLK